MNNNSNIKISIIVPIYNVEKYLKECIDSALNQTLKDIEIILIDDGGKDNCPQIIDEYAQKDPRIVAIHKQNGGYGQSCNVGLEKARGEYIAILEPDDYIKPEMYEDLYKIARENDADIVKSEFIKNYDLEDYKELKSQNWSKLYNLPKGPFKITECPYFLALHPSIWTCIYKNEFLKRHNIKFIEAPGAGWTDNPFQVQTMCLAQKICFTNKEYYYWRVLDRTDAQALKNYTLPFVRSEEIHEWLRKENITDSNILAALYERELSYISIVLSMEEISDIKDCKQKIKQLCNNMDFKTVFTSKYVRFRNKKIFIFCKFFNKLINLYRYRKKLIKIRFNRHEKSIIICGKKIY